MWSNNEDSRTSVDSPVSVTSRQRTLRTPTTMTSQPVLSSIPPSYYNEDEEKAEAVVEYEWPIDSGKIYFIEEYLADFLGMKSLRRQYPKVGRRRIQAVEEREYLLRQKLVNLLQCDLGVIAVSSEHVYKYVAPRHKTKFDIYEEIQKARGYDEMLGEMWRLSSSRNLVSPENLKAMAMRACASWNGENNQSTRGFRSKYRDTQTGNFHRRQSTKEINAAKSKVGYFPVSILTGQYVDHYKRYTPEELKRLPLNTVIDRGWINCLKNSYKKRGRIAKPAATSRSVTKRKNKTNARAVKTKKVSTVASKKSQVQIPKITDDAIASRSTNSSSSSLFEVVVKKKQGK